MRLPSEQIKPIVPFDDTTETKEQIDKRFNLEERINNSQPIIMRCCGCEYTVEQLPLIPVGNCSYVIKDNNLNNKLFVCTTKQQDLGWTPYYCTNCESIRQYKVVPTPKDKPEEYSVWDDL